MPAPAPPDRDREIVALVEAAWADAVYPGDSGLAGRDSCCGEYGYVAEFFRGRHWRDVTVESLRQYEGPANACCSFMSGEALRFYLPAFLLIALDEPASGPRSDWEASLVDIAVWALNPPRYRPEVRALIERHTPGSDLGTEENTAELRRWWEARMTGFTPDQHDAIVAVLRRLHERRPDDHEVAEALEHWAP